MSFLESKVPNGLPTPCQSRVNTLGFQSLPLRGMDMIQEFGRKSFQNLKVIMKLKKLKELIKCYNLFIKLYF